MSTKDSSAATPEPSKRTAPTSHRRPTRRRPWAWITASALVCGAVVGNAVLIAQMADREPMLVLARDVPWGQQLSGEDVATVELPADVREFTVPDARRGQVLGLVAGQNLRAGQLLTRSDLIRQAVPGPGQRVLGLRLEPGRYPAGGLAPNDPVAVHPAPDATSGTAAPTAVGSNFTARVVRASAPDADGAITVDLLIPETTAAAAVEAAVSGAQVSLLGPAQ